MSQLNSIRRIPARPLPAITRIPVTNRRFVLAASAAIYTLVLWYNYKELISPVFTYMSFFYYDHSLSYLVFDVILAVLPTLYMPTSVTRPSHFGLMLLYVIVYIPSMFLTTYAAASITDGHITLKICMAIAFWVTVVVSQFQIRLELPTVRWPPKLFMIAVLGLSCVSVMVLGLSYGFNIQLHALTEVYTQRDLYKAGLEEASYNRFFTGMTANVLCPIMISYGLVYRNILYGAAGAMLAIYVFSITGLKSSLMSILYVTATWVLIRYFAQRAFWMILLGAFVICLLGMATASGSLNVINDLFVRRTFTIQGLLSNFYYEFFETHPFVYLSHSILSPFFDQPIMRNPDETVGTIYLGEEVHANASLFSDGYLNAGFYGVFISSFIVGAFLCVVDFCTRKVNLVLATSTFAMIFMMICQTGIVKIIGMHGGLFACLLMLISDFGAKTARASVSSGGAASTGFRGSRAF